MSKIKSALASFLDNKDETLNYDDDPSITESDYQNANGAPVEKVNPLGYNVGYFTAFYLTVQGMIGTGIFATPSSVLQSLGSISATYVLWFSGFIITLMELAIQIEYIMYMKKRSGGMTAYLEQAYPKPDFMIPTTYAAVTVFLSFFNASAIAFGSYILSAAKVEASAWTQRGVGVASLTFTCLVVAISNKWSLRFSNLLAFIKTAFCLFIAITGFVVLAGGTRVEKPLEIFKNPWEGTTTDGNAISNAILKVSFSFGGTQFLLSLVGETHPKKTKNMFRFFVPGVLFFVFILYILMVTAYYAGISSKEEISNSGTTIASLFFTHVFGTERATQALDTFVALAALGHLMACTIGHSRMLRECGRQGVLPYSRAWSSTKPFGTPLLPIFVTWIVNVIMSVAPPPGDAYNFIVDMGSYSGYIFKLLLVVGIFLVRKQRKEAGLPKESFKVPTPIVIVIILYEAFVLAMAFVPPANGSTKGSDVSFFYCTYALTTIGIVALCFVYYFVWAFALPRLYKYEHRMHYYTLENGEVGHTVVKVYKQDLAKWDAEHDDTGRSIDAREGDSESVEQITISINDKSNKNKLSS